MKKSRHRTGRRAGDKTNDIFPLCIFGEREIVKTSLVLYAVFLYKNNIICLCVRSLYLYIYLRNIMFPFRVTNLFTIKIYYTIILLILLFACKMIAPRSIFQLSSSLSPSPPTSRRLVWYFGTFVLLIPFYSHHHHHHPAAKNNDILSLAVFVFRQQQYKVHYKLFQMYFSMHSVYIVFWC